MFGVITGWKKTFGFITTIDGDSFFFHISNFDKNTSPILEGRVEFDVAAPTRVGLRPQAVNVRYRKAAQGAKIKIFTVVEIPFTGGEPQKDFNTEAEAKAFIQSVRDGKNPFSGRPLSEHPYEYRAEGLGVTSTFIDAEDLASALGSGKGGAQ